MQSNHASKLLLGRDLVRATTPIDYPRLANKPRALLTPKIPGQRPIGTWPMEITRRQTIAWEICLTLVQVLSILKVCGRASHFDLATDKIYRASAKIYLLRSITQKGDALLKLLQHFMSYWPVNRITMLARYNT